MTEDSIINSEIVREDNNSLLEYIIPEISERQAWKSELNEATTKTGKLIAVGLVCKKALYTAVGEDVCLFVPSLNNHVCIDKIPTEEEDSPFMLSDKPGVYAEGVKNHVRYVFSDILTAEDGTINKKTAVSYSYMGACSDYVDFDRLRSLVKTADKNKEPVLSPALLEFVTNFNKTDSSIKAYVKALNDDDYTAEEKAEYRQEIASKILDKAKEQKIIERKLKTMETAVYNLVVTMF